ncbi:MAG: 16S rRNA (guanine(966)-N(2))-methyltransferase RsmD [Gammaproteobacteria bacterium]|nr:16S rRNA (guanine(966)-N(2))-methyltransferase RsmD [Gammaproteobacteria bacterium]
MVPNPPRRRHLGYSFTVANRADKSDSRAELRIIGGRWRGRKLRFAADDIRPTGDRVRETLFNWLAPQLPGARCLDMFAGSGALGIEALSRLATEVVFIERQAHAAATIEDHLRTFGARPHSYTVINSDALDVPLEKHGPFEIVFLDPPFAADGTTNGITNDKGRDLANLCTLLENSGALADQCLIYLEMDLADPLPPLPEHWQVSREKTAGQVRYALADRTIDDNGP